MAGSRLDLIDPPAGRLLVVGGRVVADGAAAEVVDHYRATA